MSYRWADDDGQGDDAGLSHYLYGKQASNWFTGLRPKRFRAARAAHALRRGAPQQVKQTVPYRLTLLAQIAYDRVKFLPRGAWCAKSAGSLPRITGGS